MIYLTIDHDRKNVPKKHNLRLNDLPIACYQIIIRWNDYDDDSMKRKLLESTATTICVTQNFRFARMYVCGF